MKMASSLKILLTTCLVVLSLVQHGNSLGIHNGSAVFCYDFDDPSCNEKSDEWPGICKTGSRQSPIDVHLGLVNLFPTFLNSLFTPHRQLTFDMKAYATNSFYIINNGHSVQVQFDAAATSSATMTGYGLNENYAFAQAHFHWGPFGLPGSEHTVNGIRHTMEVHLVHYKQKYGSVAAAAGSGDPQGLAVLAVFIQGIPLGQLASGHKAIAPVSANMPIDYNPSGKLVNQILDLSLLLPKSGAGIYRYDGSLTTPNCTEAVMWSVVKDPVRVSIADVLRFQTVHDEYAVPLRHNYRSLQKATKEHKLEYFTVQ